MTSFECPMPEKVQGYLEKRSKVNFWRWWKKYWFVLDGKMLLYFKTKEDYEQLGRCRGSINMSLAQAVQPSCSARRSYPIEVITRTKTVQLSACDEDNRQKWLSALQNAIRLPEISSPVFERLSSRLSANLSLKRPFSQRNSEILSDAETIKRDDLSADIRHSKIDESISSSISQDSNSDSNCAAEVSSEKDITTVTSNNMLTTVNSLNSPTSDISKIKTDTETSKGLRPRTRSLYEEIVEEVLEITSRKLSNQSIKESDNAKQSKNEEFLKDFTAILQDERKNFQENKISINTPPVKPPRTESQKLSNSCPVENMSSSQIQNKKLRVKNEVEIENEVYESANESSYVTAESSEYEGDTSSYSSIGSNKSNINSLNTVTENLISASTGSEASMESIQPQTGSLCNMLDVTDGSDSCHSNVPINDNISVSEEVFTNKSNCIDRRFSLNVLEKMKKHELMETNRKHSE